MKVKYIADHETSVLKKGKVYDVLSKETKDFKKSGVLR